MKPTPIRVMSIPRIAELREGDVVPLRVQAGVIVNALVLGDVQVKTTSKRERTGRFLPADFNVPLCYYRPGTRDKRYVHITPYRRDMLVEIGAS